MKFPERDYKYVSSLRNECLQRLCTRINDGAAAILADTKLTPHERYLELYQHVSKSDKVMADLFDRTWSRSKLDMVVFDICSEKLIPSDFFDHVSDGMKAYCREYNLLK